MDIAELIDLEEIRQLKYRYLRGIDTHDVELVRSCFAEDATAAYSDGKYTLSGRDQILDFIIKALDPTSGSSHIATHPEIQLIDRDHAKGTWRLQDYVQFTQPNQAIHHIPIQGGEELQGAGHYHDKYERRDGSWKITHTGYRRLYERIVRPGGHLTIG